MRRRPMVVAFEECLNAQDRLWLDVAGGTRLTDKERRRPPGKGRFWCAADKPSEGMGFQLRPVYRTTKLPTEEGGAPVTCETCYIEIEKLQEELTRTIRTPPL